MNFPINNNKTADRILVFTFFVFCFLVFIISKAFNEEKEKEKSKNLLKKQIEIKEKHLKEIVCVFLLRDTVTDSVKIYGRFNQESEDIVKMLVENESKKFLSTDTLYQEKIFNNVTKKYIFFL